MCKGPWVTRLNKRRTRSSPPRCERGRWRPRRRAPGGETLNAASQPAFLGNCKGQNTGFSVRSSCRCSLQNKRQEERTRAQRAAAPAAPRDPLTAREVVGCGRVTNEVREVLERLRRGQEAEVVGGGERWDGAGGQVVAAVVAVLHRKHDCPRFLQPLHGVVAVNGCSDL